MGVVIKVLYCVGSQNHSAQVSSIAELMLEHLYEALSTTVAFEYYFTVLIVPSLLHLSLYVGTGFIINYDNMYSFLCLLKFVDECY